MQRRKLGKDLTKAADHELGRWLSPLALTSPSHGG